MSDPGFYSEIEVEHASLFFAVGGRAVTPVWARRGWAAWLSRAKFLAAAIAAVMVCGSPVAPAWSAAPPPAPPSSSTPTGALPSGLESSTMPAPTAHVLGFRSAKFGMSEDEVRAAITSNFSQSGAALKVSSNAVEQTKIITIKVPDLLPDSGMADVSYVFGYKTKKLIQISIAWSSAADPKTTPEKLVVTGEMLRAGFVDQGYKSDSVILNKPVKTGVLMFRGQDTEDHTTILLLQGSTSPDKNSADKESKILVPTELLLLYIADVKRPDIFKVLPGQF